MTKGYTPSTSARQACTWAAAALPPRATCRPLRSAPSASCRFAACTRGARGAATVGTLITCANGFRRRSNVQRDAATVAYGARSGKQPLCRPRTQCLLVSRRCRSRPSLRCACHAQTKTASEVPARSPGALARAFPFVRRCTARLPGAGRGCPAVWSRIHKREKVVECWATKFSVRYLCRSRDVACSEHERDTITQSSRAHADSVRDSQAQRHVTHPGGQYSTLTPLVRPVRITTRGACGGYACMMPSHEIGTSSMHPTERAAPPVAHRPATLSRGHLRVSRPHHCVPLDVYTATRRPRQRRTARGQLSRRSGGAVPCSTSRPRPARRTASGTCVRQSRASPATASPSLQRP